VTPTRIVFMSDRDGTYDIYVMDADGQNLARLTNNTDFDGYPRRARSSMVGRRGVGPLRRSRPQSTGAEHAC
jgi:tricorn protease-like protein